MSALVLAASRTDQALELRQKIAILEGERVTLIAKQRPLQQQVAKVEREKADAESALARLEVPTVEPRVSDHAIIRYLERKHGFDFEGARRSILTPERKSAIRSGAVAINYDGFSFKVSAGVVTTVIET